MIPYGRQNISEDDVEAVVAVLKSDFLTQGPQVPAFEKALAAYCGVVHAVAVNSATSALHIACLALGVGEGDVVWTSPISFVASSNCALYCGADVDFVDIDPDTWNISVPALEKKLEAAEQQKRLPKVVIPVHLCGRPCDMAAIRQLSERYGFKVIEDASHAVGGRYRDNPVGSCQYSDVTVFSFHPVKIITSAEGGMALCNDAEVASRMALYRSHGVTRDDALMTKPSDGPWYYQQVTLGFNYRMTELQAALGLSQMKRLDEFVAKRHEIAARYDELLRDLPLQIPTAETESYSGLHLYIIRLKDLPDSTSHRQVFESLREQGIGVNLHYIPIHTQPYYQSLGFTQGQFPEAEAYYGEAISLPMFPDLTLEQQDQVVSALVSAINQRG